MMKKSLKMAALLAVFAGCTSTGTENARIVVGEPNDLGVVALEIDRFADNGDVFELRAVDAAGAQVALVKVRKGAVEGLAPTAEPAIGSEIEVTVGSARERALTREVEELSVDFHTPAIQQFMTLPTVASALEREAHLSAAPKEASGNSGEASYTLQQCVASNLLTTPVAEHCCQWTGTVGKGHIQFVRPSDGAAIFRQKWPACTSSTKGTCSGAACYGGPQGYLRASVYPATGGQTWKVYAFVDEAGETCATDYYGTNSYGNVTGTTPTSAGCCGNGTGACGMPGKPACATCGGSSGEGQWDY